MGTGMSRFKKILRPLGSRAAAMQGLRKVFVMICALSMATAPMTVAHADGDPAHIKIDDSGLASGSRSMVLGLDKAAIIELPVDARDVLVSNPKIVDAVVRTSRRTYLIGMAVGQTNAFFFNDKGKQILNLEISVERDLSRLRASLQAYFPDSNIDVQAMNDHIVLSGTVANAIDADKAKDMAARYVGNKDNVLSMLSITGKEQVMLKVTVAEMQRTVLKQLGIDLSSAASIGDFALNLATSNSFSLQGTSLGGLNSTGTGYTAGSTDISSTLKALERDTLVRTLAEPNLTAISGESAKFLAGGEFPVPVARDRDGNVTLEYKPYGVGLNFTPVVMSEGRISLKISTEVSELTAEGAFVYPGQNSATIPGLRVRRAETTLELPSGGSLVMAGLLSDQTRQNIDGVPGIKDLPVLGALFRSRDYLKNETELVVIVTPYIVDPTSRDKLSLPTDGVAPASDMDTVLMGRLNATYGTRGGAVTDRKLQGPVGYVVE